jgi:hypothetical protein
MRWLHAPLLHFLAGGALLFGVWRLMAPAPVAAGAAAAPIVISAGDIAQMREAYTTETGLQATDDDEVKLVDRAVDEELLFREAMARHLDRGDQSIRNWLIEQMRVLADDPRVDEQTLYSRALALELDRKDLVVRRILVQKMRLLAARSGEGEIDEAVLRDYYAAHAADYAQAPRVTIWHVFLAADRDADPAGDAAALLAELQRGGVAPADAVGRGDPFPLPSHLASQSRQQLEKVFGGAVAAAALDAAPHTWVGPLPSPVGLHLIWVERRDAVATPPFDSVRGRVTEAWYQEARARRLAELLRELRARSALRVESRPWNERDHA